MTSPASILSIYQVVKIHSTGVTLLENLALFDRFPQLIFETISACITGCKSGCSGFIRDPITYWSHNLLNLSDGQILTCRFEFARTRNPFKRYFKSQFSIIWARSQKVLKIIMWDIKVINQSFFVKQMNLLRSICPWSSYILNQNLTSFFMSHFRTVFLRW